MAVTRSLTDSAQSGSGLTTYTFSSKSIGVADSARIVAVGVMSEATSTGMSLSSATIGGVTATIGKQQTNDATIGIIAAIIWAVVPTGTTGDVVVTFSGGQYRCAIDVYRVMGANTTTPINHTYSDSTASDNPQTISGGISVSANGAAIGCATADAGAATTTWAGIDVDSDVTSVITYSSASKEFASAQSGLTTSATFSLSPGRAALVVCSFQVATVALTLTAAAGSYTLTGIAAALNAGKTMVAAAGSYTLTGIAATLKSARKLTAAVGSYSLTGITARLGKGYTLTSAAGSYVLTGIAATMRLGHVLTAAAGSYAITGITAFKKISRNSATGTYVLTGNAATLFKSLTLHAATGIYALTGLAIVLARLVAPASKFKLRRSAFRLRKTRTTQPILDD